MQVYLIDWLLFVLKWLHYLLKFSCPELPVTYPEFDNVPLVNVEPPSLDIDAIISVFNVGLVTFSSNTTIRDVVGTLVDVKAFETIVVDVVVAETAKQPIINT